MADHQKAYDDVLIQKTTPKRGLQVSFNPGAVSQPTHQPIRGIPGAVLQRDPVEAMRVHRDKDAVEKCFDDLKNSLDMKRLRMHTSATVDGRLFVQFIALEYLTQYGGNHGHPSLPVGSYFSSGVKGLAVESLNINAYHRQPIVIFTFLWRAKKSNKRNPALRSEKLPAPVVSVVDCFSGKSWAGINPAP